MSPGLLLIGKKGDDHCASAVEHVRKNFVHPEIRLVRRGDRWPADVDDWSGDYIISYLSPFIIPEHLLRRARRAAINFHPGPPAYPGIGCTNFAIYNGEAEFGVTCHHMDAKVDTGPIVAVRRFPLHETDSVRSLTERCYESILELFLEICELVLADKPMPVSSEEWQRKPFNRHELDELCRITLDMSPTEVARRVRAVTYPGAPGAFIELHGYRFEYGGEATARK